MKNYIYLDGKKIELSEETAKNLANEVNKEIELFPELKDKNKYWYILSSGEIDDDYWSNSYGESCISNFGNAFNTREEAQKEADRILMHRKLAAYAKIKNGAWEPDWSNDFQSKYCISYDNEDNEFNIDMGLCHQIINQVYFKEREHAQDAIEYFGDELKALL